MEREFRLNDVQLAETIVVALQLGYRFLPHDRIVAQTSVLEQIEFMTSAEMILNRITQRGGADWFHLVRKDWSYEPFTVHRIDNQYRGLMDFVDQRSWGPYFDFQIRKMQESKGEYPYSVQTYLYPRFLSPDLEREYSTPKAVKKDYLQFCKLIESRLKQFVQRW